MWKGIFSVSVEETEQNVFLKDAGLYDQISSKQSYDCVKVLCLCMFE